jgi:hypothetical protein
MIAEKLDRFMSSRRVTLLGVGPMSKNCVDVTIDLANKFSIPIFLIASRRQIESAEFGGGYVENWSTEDFADYVSKRDKRGQVILARDHGGPWQNTFEVDKQFSLRDAMASAKRSFEVDIASGFQKIHIDPSVSIHGALSADDVLDRVFELYEFCWATAQRLRREIIFEIGTEEQSGHGQSLEELEYCLTKTNEFCLRNKMPLPKFVVVQTGTRTAEMRNVGTFDSPFKIKNELPAEIQIPRILELCARFGVYMKEHNADYLSTSSLEWHPKFGIHAANVAPEFGVAESKAFLQAMKKLDMTAEINEFVSLAVRSNKWKKWMVKDTTATDEERALICGHYVFAHPEFLEIKRRVSAQAAKRNISLEDDLRSAVKRSVERYLSAFGLLEE